METLRALTLILLLAPGTAAGLEMKEWKFQAGIQPPSQPSSPQFVRLTLPGWVLANAREDLADLRVISASGAEIPYLLQRAENRTFHTTLPASIINRGIDPGRFEQIVCDLGERVEISNQVILYTQATNFVRKVDIAGSADGRTWITIRSGAYIFQQPGQGRELRNLTVPYPDSTYRFLRVAVWFDGGLPLKFTGAEVQRLERAEFQPETVEAAIVRQSEDAERKATDLVAETRMSKQHFEECLIDPKEENFDRPVTVSYQDHRGAWVDVGSGAIHRFTIGPTVDENLIVAINDLNQKQFRIRIWNSDSPPLSVRSLRLRRMPRMLVFNASPADRYRLFFGDDDAEPRAYDLRGALGRLDLEKLPQASLQAMAPNPSFAPKRREQPWTERHPIIIWAALALGVLLLAAMLLKTVRSVS